MPQSAMHVMTVDESGAYVAPGGGEGGGGDASAANQVTQTALLTEIETAVDGLETLVAATNTALGTIDGRVDGLETAVAATNTKLDTAIGHLDGVESGLALIHGWTVQSAVEITRPANTTAYTAKDAIADLTSGATILTFANCARSAGGSGYVTKARLQTDQAANVSAYRLHLYDATLTSVVDNAPMTVLYANRASYLGYIDFPAASTDGSDTATSQSTDKPLPFVAVGTSLFGMLETITGFTPASGQKFYVQLGIEQN